KVGHNTELDQLARTLLGMLVQAQVGLAFRLAARDVILFPNTFRHPGEGKTVEAAAHMPAGIAVLQAPGQDLIQGGTGNDSELAELGDGPRQPPTRYPNAHAALNDGRMLTHKASIHALPEEPDGQTKCVEVELRHGLFLQRERPAPFVPEHPSQSELEANHRGTLGRKL